MTTADVRLRSQVLLLHGRILQDHECLPDKACSGQRHGDGSAADMADYHAELPGQTSDSFGMALQGVGVLPTM